jgi:pyridoxine 4-dehydrogenase
MRERHSRIVFGLYRSSHRRELLERALELGIKDLDTAFNYAGFSSHSQLSHIAGDLLPKFFLSTKIGFFPSTSSEPEHSLDPVRLRESIEATVERLGRPPDVVFLHNPERSMANVETACGWAILTDAAAVLTDAVDENLCASWGISTWDPGPLLAVARSATDAWALNPSHLMHRSGLLTGTRIMDSTDELADILRIGVSARWGISPFGGDSSANFWRQLRLDSLFVKPTAATIPQMAFRLAFELPYVDRVAVSLGTVGHLHDLVAAVGLEVDDRKIARYRDLLGARQRSMMSTSAPTGPSSPVH